MNLPRIYMSILSVALGLTYVIPLAYGIIMFKKHNEPFFNLYVIIGLVAFLMLTVLYIELVLKNHKLESKDKKKWLWMILLTNIYGIGQYHAKFILKIDDLYK